MTTLTTIVSYFENEHVEAGSFITSSLDEVFREVNDIFGGKLRFYREGDIHFVGDAVAEDKSIGQPRNLGHLAFDAQSIQHVFIQILRAILGDDCSEQDKLKVISVEGSHNIRAQGADWAGCSDFFAL